MVDAPKPVIPDNQGKKYKVSVFMSPDHSIEPLADFVQSAKKSIDMYIPGEIIIIIILYYHNSFLLNYRTHKLDLQ